VGRIYGQFSAVDYVEMRPRVSGYIESVHFKDGQLVKAGDLLYIIDPRPFDIALKSAQAQLETAKAQLGVAQRQLEPLQARCARTISWRPVSTTSGLGDAAAATAAMAAGQAAVEQAQLDLEFTHVTAPIGGRIGRIASPWEISWSGLRRQRDPADDHSSHSTRSTSTST